MTVEQAYLGAELPAKLVCLKIRATHFLLHKPQDWMLLWSYRCEIWQASWQRSCQGACQIVERLKKSKPEYRGFETLRDRAVRPLPVKWIEDLNWQQTLYHGVAWGHCWYLTKLYRGSMVTLQSFYDDLTNRFVPHTKFNSHWHVRPEYNIEAGRISSPSPINI